jgi:transcriptional regulator with XRE-family HTH domain
VSLPLAFGVVLRQLRLEANLTQEELGLQADIQRKHVSMLELGEKQPTLATIFKLADALSVKPSRFIQMVDIKRAEIKD